MIKGYLQTRAQDGLSLLIAAALAAYGCVSVGLTAVDFEIVEDPFQQLFVSNKQHSFERCRTDSFPSSPFPSGCHPLRVAPQCVRGDRPGVCGCGG